MAAAATRLGGVGWGKRRKNKLLQPGWAGALTDEEVDFLQRRLAEEPGIAIRWGFRPGMKTHSEQAVRRVAMYGEPDNPSWNGKLTRQRSTIVPRDGEPVVD